MEVMGCTGPSKALVPGLGLLSLTVQYKQSVPRGGGAGAVVHMGCARHQRGWRGLHLPRLLFTGR